MEIIVKEKNAPNSKFCPSLNAGEVEASEFMLPATSKPVSTPVQKIGAYAESTVHIRVHFPDIGPF